MMKHLEREVIASWQDDWDDETGYYWMKKLIPLVPKEPNEVPPQNFYLAQAITGIGCFGAYLGKIGRRESASCQCDSNIEETPQHIMDECQLFSIGRPAQLNISESATRNYLINTMKTLWKEERETRQAML